MTDRNPFTDGLIRASNPYRTPGEVAEGRPVKLSRWQRLPVRKQRAPELRTVCVYCGDLGRSISSGRLNIVRNGICSPHRRAGWFWNRCDLGGMHRHFDCETCGMRWIETMPEPETSP